MHSSEFDSDSTSQDTLKSICTVAFFDISSIQGILGATSLHDNLAGYVAARTRKLGIRMHIWGGYYKLWHLEYVGRNRMTIANWVG